MYYEYDEYIDSDSGSVREVFLIYCNEHIAAFEFVHGLGLFAKVDDWKIQKIQSWTQLQNILVRILQWNK